MQRAADTAGLRLPAAGGDSANLSKARKAINKQKENSFYKLRTICEKSESQNGDLSNLSVNSSVEMKVKPNEDKAIDGMFLAVNNLAPWKDEELTE